MNNKIYYFAYLLNLQILFKKEGDNLSFSQLHNYAVLATDMENM